MEWYMYLAVIAAGLFAGFVNTLAGSGSLITLPLLMFLGLPANVANGTNRIGVFVQSLVSSTSFKKQKLFTVKEGLRMSLPALAGALLGSLIAVRINEHIMELLIGGLLIIMFFIILYKPEQWVRDHALSATMRRRWWVPVIFFLIGIYGGFIQAGVGFFLLGGLVLGAGLGLTKANAHKVFIVAVMTTIALVVFIASDQIHYLYGIVLAAGQGVGAWLGSRVAVSWGPRVVRVILLVAIMASALKLTGFFDLVTGLF
ncbi:MAG: sulfite exporter TauE/SafE family protein [Bacteroidales bacterium]|mgnify:FL=1|nr:sulfite exporter TauE/SafE family protein [Bacteroidales bacterium]